MAAIRDPQVTSIAARVVPKCDHDATPPKLDAVDERAQLLPGILEPPTSDTNGFDPVGRA